jgi:hypothetical protein
MSSAGHVSDMISRLRNNRELRITRKEKRSRVMEMYNHPHMFHQNLIHERYIDPEKLNAVILEIDRKSKIDRFKEMTITVTVFCVMTVMLFALFLWWK